MLTFLFALISLYFISSLFTDGVEENSFERSYRKMLDCFWCTVSGIPVCRQGY